MTSAYSRGANFERRVRSYYEKKGYLVIRSAGSRSPLDLLALKAGEVILIQVKIDGRLSAVEREQLKAIADENRCQAHLVSREEKSNAIIIEKL